MLALSVNNFKAAMIKMLQRAIMNRLETNEKKQNKVLARKIETPRKELEDNKEEPNENFELQTIISEIRQWMDSIAEWRGQRKELVNWKTVQ